MRGSVLSFLCILLKLTHESFVLFLFTQLFYKVHFQDLNLSLKDSRGICLELLILGILIL